MKIVIGLFLGFGIGFVCSIFKLPLPSPPVLFGSGLVICMTLGYVIVDKFISTQAKNRIHCGGPSPKS